MRYLLKLFLRIIFDIFKQHLFVHTISKPAVTFFQSCKKTSNRFRIHHLLSSSMDASDAPTTPKEVELREVNATPPENKKQQQLIVDVNITFCTHVGWDGVLVMVFMLIVAGLFGYTTYQYTSYFNNFHRDFVWLFMVMGGLFVLVVVYYLLRWKHIANTFMEEERKTQEETEEAATSCFEQSKTRYNSFQIFGKYYLWLLYTGEITESINQTINIFTVYTCSLPVGWTSGMCIALCIDCFHTVSFMVRENDSNRRDRQIIVDTLVDFLCTALPLSLMWFGYKVPISVQDMIQIAFFPAFMMLLKLDTILEEMIRSRTAAATVKVQEETATRASRRRKSLYRGLSHFEIAEQQQAAVPRVVHMGAAGCKCIFGLIFLSIAIVQLAVQHGTTCEQLLWKSCVVKTPFCGNVFRPTCNCVVLNVRKHNWTTLPGEIQEMNALKVMRINHGPLQEMPKNIDEKFHKISKLDLSFNALIEVPEGLGNMPINKLILQNNKLNKLPDKIWGNQYIFDLELDNNNISVVSPSILRLKVLSRLYISNNTLCELPVEMFSLNLATLMLDGNHLKNIPPEIGKVTSLQTVTFNNNLNITAIPKEIGNLLSLRSIDFRNNDIESLPNDFGSLRGLKHVYLHNNPICSNGWIENSASKQIQDIVAKNDNAGCIAQCSMYCPNRFKGDKMCDSECNSVSCEYDGGDCL